MTRLLQLIGEWLTRREKTHEAEVIRSLYWGSATVGELKALTGLGWRLAPTLRRMVETGKIQRIVFASKRGSEPIIQYGVLA